MGWYRCEYVKCGKPRCGTCPHGPYWYYYWREDGRTRKRYHGKADPRADVPPVASEGPYWEAMFSRRTATLAIALRILGVNDGRDVAAVKLAFRRLSLENHPDRQGDARFFAAISAAYAYVRAVFKW